MCFANVVYLMTLKYTFILNSFYWFLFYFADAEEAHAAAEERKRVRKLRSRRDRCKNGAQFTQNLYPEVKYFITRTIG